MLETYTAIQSVCAWPNLKRMDDGTLIATIFNQPCHGLWEGDLDCWSSEDDGRTWRYRSTPGKHEPGTNRMNCAAGFASNGDMLVITSGYGERGKPWEPSTGYKVFLDTIVCRSSDGARTWNVLHDFPAPGGGAGIGAEGYIPFGDIEQADDGSLCVSVYGRKNDKGAALLLRSRDDGYAWGEPLLLNEGGNETDILHLGGGKWLAASRMHEAAAGGHIELCASDDDGKTWNRRGPLTLPGQVTGNITRLQDGRILLSYGVRNRGNFGVSVRLSEDEGASWGAPVRIAGAPEGDCGYPSSVQLPDGRIVTAFYTKISQDFHYEMRVVRWKPDFDLKGLSR